MSVHETSPCEFSWEFIFIGANIDAVETAARYGISEDRAVNYNADKIGTKILYETVFSVVGDVRASKPIECAWSGALNEDYERRAKKHK